MHFRSCNLLRQFLSWQPQLWVCLSQSDCLDPFCRLCRVCKPAMAIFATTKNLVRMFGTTRWLLENSNAGSTNYLKSCASSTTVFWTSDNSTTTTLVVGSQSKRISDAMLPSTSTVPTNCLTHKAKSSLLTRLQPSRSPTVLWLQHSRANLKPFL